MTNVPIMRVERLDLRLMPYDWPFAAEHRTEIDAHFALRQREKPELWNGRILVMRDRALIGTSLCGSFFETDFASFLAWRDWGVPDLGVGGLAVTDCFACAALQTGDGAFLLGVMGRHTANAGQIYFPCGAPDLDDLKDGRVDFESNVRRELKEETGFDADDFEPAAGWWAVDDEPRLVLVKALRSSERAEATRARILANLAHQAQPELSDIRIVRSRADFDPMMPRYVCAYLDHAWAMPA